MPHTDIHAISARQNKINKRWDKTTASFCCRTAAISAPFTPLSTFRFQPLPGVATHGIDVDITFHYVTSQFSAFGRLGVWQARRCSAFLGVARRHRCLQVSTFTDLSVARRIRSVGSVGRRWQPQRAAAAGAGGRAMGWTTPPHHTITPKNIIAKFRGTRLVPYDLEAVLSKLNIKIRILILINPPFTNASLWVS